MARMWQRRLQEGMPLIGYLATTSLAQRATTPTERNSRPLFGNPVPVGCQVVTRKWWWYLGVAYAGAQFLQGMVLTPSEPSMSK